jgi:hypothetical protein
MVDIVEKKQKILSFLQANGPTLPVRIAKVIEMEPVFSSAILSELYSDRKIKMSNMKIGSSSLFYLEGQEEKLQDFIDNLKSIEKEAFARIKSRKVLVDDDEEPAIRVAIRGMKDFAIPVERDGKLYWKFAFVTEEDFENYFKPKVEKKTEEKINEKISDEKMEKEDEEKESIRDDEGEKIKFEEKEKREIEKPEKKWRSNRVENIDRGESEKMTPIFEESSSEFYEEIKDFLKKKGVLIVEEIQVDKKEVVARIVIKNNIADLNYLLIAKNKKSINKDEINVLLQRSNYHKMPCLLILRKEPSKSILSIIKENNFITLGVME